MLSVKSLAIPAVLTFNAGLLVLSVLLALLLSLFALTIFCFLINSDWRAMGAVLMVAAVVSAQFAGLAGVTAVYDKSANSDVSSWDGSVLRLAISLMTVATAVVRRFACSKKWSHSSLLRQLFLAVNVQHLKTSRSALNQQVKRIFASNVKLGREKVRVPDAIAAKRPPFAARVDRRSRALAAHHDAHSHRAADSPPVRAGLGAADAVARQPRAFRRRQR